MAYRDDPDLRFLGQMSSEDLGDLVYCLTHDKDGTTRWVEGLTGSVDYKRYYPNHRMYWMQIAAEIQEFGGNSIVNTLFRFGDGVLYREVLTNVCDKLKVKYNAHSPVHYIETKLLSMILDDVVGQMTPDQLFELARECGVPNVSDVGKPTKAAIAIALQAGLRAGGFMSYKLAVIIANFVLKTLIGRGLTVAANAALTRTIGMFLGPVGWVLSGVWLAFDIAGTAYRVTVPAVINVAVLRQKHMYAG